MISTQILQKLQTIIRREWDGVIDPKLVYLYKIPEKDSVIKHFPMVKIQHVLSSTNAHANNTLWMTKERVQIQYFFDDDTDVDFEDIVQRVDDVLEEEGFYFSTGYDFFDPDYEGVIGITRQYNFRNKTY